MVGLTTVTFAPGSQLTSIGNEAFDSCINLASIEIPASVTSIGSYAFNSNTKLTSVTFAVGSKITSANFGEGVFPVGSNGYGGDNLRTAYLAGGAGTYRRAAGGDVWTKQ